MQPVAMGRPAFTGAGVEHLERAALSKIVPTAAHIENVPGRKTDVNDAHVDR